jgi:hypothetical protein
MFENNAETQLDKLNVELKKLEDKLDAKQQEQLDIVLKLSSEIFVSEVLKREFDVAFQSGPARMVLQYVNGKYVLRLIK